MRHPLFDSPHMDRRRPEKFGGPSRACNTEAAIQTGQARASVGNFLVATMASGTVTTARME
jgi:hypothetical protein